MNIEADVVEIAPALFRVRIPSARAHLLNCYIVLGDDDVTLIDCGWSDSAPIIDDSLRQPGRKPSDIRRLVLTHFHEDHVGSATQITDWSDVTVIAGRLDAEFIRGVQPGPLPALTAAELAIHAGDRESIAGPPTRVDVEVDDGDQIDIAGGVVVLGVPGHTPGSIGLHIPNLDVVITGDVAAEFDGQVIAGAFHLDRAQVRKSVRKLADTGAQVAAFGHGEAVTTDAASRLAAATDPLG